MKSFFAAVLLLAVPALAEVDVAALYDLNTEGSSARVKAGEKATVVLTIKTKDGAHVSDEAPLKIELSSKQSKLDKQKLTLADSVTKKPRAGEYADPRFEVGVTPTAQGKTSVEAKMTFFICTDTICARQQKTLSVPIDVE